MSPRHGPSRRDQRGTLQSRERRWRLASTWAYRGPTSFPGKRYVSAPRGTASRLLIEQGEEGARARAERARLVVDDMEVPVDPHALETEAREPAARHLASHRVD